MLLTVFLRRWISVLAFCWAMMGYAPAAPLVFAPAPADNPLKGFMPYAGSYTFPHSMEWTYFSLKDVQVDIGQFRWSTVDKLLNAVASRGHQAVFRTYLDYPNTPYGVPAFLANVPKHAYPDYDNGKAATSFSPDYDHPDLRRALTNYIAELGARYDGDPRIGFITVGLLGFWGEWHTYPYNGFGGQPDWFASVATQKEVMDAFTRAFKKTKFLMREPKPGLDFRQWPVGYHDDSFAFQTLGPEDWHFWPTIQAAGVSSIWKTEPIGGEVRPEIQLCMWESGAACVPAGQAYELCVAKTHASWMLNQEAFGGNLKGEARARAIEGARLLGYSLFVSEASFSERVLSSSLPLTVIMTNTGVAPFYYPWSARIGLLSADSKLTTRTNLWDITTVLPAKPTRFETTVDLSALASGDYRVLLQVPNPLPNGPPIRFANQAQDSVLPGWLTLGQTRVSPAPSAEASILPSGNIGIRFSRLWIGARYTLVSSSRLESSSWDVTATVTAEKTEWLWETTVPTELNGSRFYKLFETP